MKTCFVIQGFGKKTDYTDGRVLDLDASCAIIKEAVVAAAEALAVPQWMQETHLEQGRKLIELQKAFAERITAAGERVT